VDALALVVCGFGLWLGIYPGEGNPLLTLVPAVVAICGIVAALLASRRSVRLAERVRPKHARIAASITTLAAASRTPTGSFSTAAASGVCSVRWANRGGEATGTDAIANDSVAAQLH
jgi:hypothetical protein